MWVARMFCACFGFLTLKDFIEFRAFNQYIHFIVYIIYYFYYHSSIVAVLIITLKLQFILSNSLNHKEFSMWMVLRQSWRQLRFTSDIGCLNISSEKYEKPKNDSLPWYCSNCAIKIASSTVFNTNPIQAIMQNRHQQNHLLGVYCIHLNSYPKNHVNVPENLNQCLLNLPHELPNNADFILGTMYEKFLNATLRVQ